MIDPSDFCPGCNSLRCRCEEIATAENPAIAAAAIELLQRLEAPRMRRFDSALFEAAIDDAIQILKTYEKGT